jgi:hypothetical protein
MYAGLCSEWTPHCRASSAREAAAERRESHQRRSLEPTARGPRSPMHSPQHALGYASRGDLWVFSLSVVK